ncbi:MAG: hypothetical protein WC533_04095 [Candidatus Pacearchaeota archaeon]
MDLIKEAFQKIKYDISCLSNEIVAIKKELSEIQLSILEFTKFNNKIIEGVNVKPHEYPSTDRQTDKQTDTSTDNPTLRQINPTLRQINPTHKGVYINTSTDNYPFKPLKRQYIDVSIGNNGVSTDRQTDRQTDTSTHNLTQNLEKQQKTATDTTLILEQLDIIKKELRIKIKKLTSQEMLVLSTIYKLEEEGRSVDYSLISEVLTLSESSIRDYIQRIIAKGIPLEKEKLNNKRVILSISRDFKRLASINTLISLREL